MLDDLVFSRRRRELLRRRRRRIRRARAAVALALVGAAALTTAFGPASPRPGRAAGVEAAPRAAQGVAAPRCPIPASQRPSFVRASADTGLPLALLAAVAHHESRFRPQARSRAGAVGVMQVLPATGAALGIDVRTPAGNVAAGARYLAQLVGRFGSAELALAAYNAGPTAVERAGAAPTSETAAYVANVVGRWQQLNGCA